MDLDHERVRHVANLARIDLDDSEVERLTTELQTIVEYVEQLQSVDVTDVTGVANIAGLEDVTRTDSAADMLPRHAILDHAPQANAEAFLVPKAVDR